MYLARLFDIHFCGVSGGYPVLLASIVFHQDWIKDNCPENHPLFYSRLFTSGIVQRLRSKVETGIFKNEKTKLVATGVPQYVKELHKFDGLFHRVNAMEEKFLGAIRELPTKVVSEILDHIQVNGAFPISAGQVQTLVTSLEAPLLEAIANQARILQPDQQNQDQLPDVDPDTFTPWL